MCLLYGTYHRALFGPAHRVANRVGYLRTAMQEIVEGSTFGVLHDQEHVRSLGAGSEQLHNIWVGHTRQLSNLGSNQIYKLMGFK